MKKTGKRVLCFVLCIAMLMTLCISLTGCGGGGDEVDAEAVQYWVSGSSWEVDMYTRLAEEFNNTYGAEHNIVVEISMKPISNYQEVIKISSGSQNGPDVYHIGDSEFKAWILAGYIDNIQEELDAVTDLSLDDCMPTTINRLRFDRETNTSDPDDPLYAVPLRTLPTALYYNQTLFEQAGIIVVSVDEEDLDKWNNNEIPDNEGKYKRDYGLADDFVLPAKGYYRSLYPYYYDGLMTQDWVPLDPSEEIAVFNNRIAMNWDEVEDLSMLFSADYNPGPNSSAENPTTEFGTTYGYFTENWFNYGWSVGGDCLTDMNGNGTWNFGLLDPNPNYVVKDGCTFTGRTGTVYQAGETIPFVDKMDMQGDEIPVPDDVGTYYHDNENLKLDENNEYAVDGDLCGIWTGILTEMEKGTESALSELPSTREAFNRYLRLGATRDSVVDGVSGLNVSPNPNVFANRTSMNYFFSGKLAILMGTSAYLKDLTEQMADRDLKWNVAPLAIYKEYEDPSDPDCDTVVAQGVEAGHSNTTNMVIRPNSTKKAEAAAFVKWCASKEGQAIIAENGFFPNQKENLEKLTFPDGEAPSNVSVFSEALEFQRPGDWWYMPDTRWVESWCIDLNSEVRNGRMTYEQWINGKEGYAYGDGTVITRTNRNLEKYEGLFR